MARFDVWQTPTLMVRKRLALIGIDELFNAPDVGQIPADVAIGVGRDPERTSEKTTPEQLERFRRDYRVPSTNRRAMQGYGVGSARRHGYGRPYILPGYALHDELDRWLSRDLRPRSLSNGNH